MIFQRRRRKCFQLYAGFLFAAVLCFAFAACGGYRRGQTNETASNLVVLNAPANGTVRRVLVGEGVAVERGAPVIEISVETAGATPVNNNSSSTRARTGDAPATIESLQREVERAAVEVARMESLVAANAAPPAQLDAARAVYQQAQERLQQARDGRAAMDRTIAQRENSTASVNANSPAREEIVYVRATTGGTVRVISIRAGQRVVVGQPLVTILTDER